MQRVGVIGGGTMGAGIAEVCARSGSDAVVVEAEFAGAERCRARIEAVPEAESIKLDLFRRLDAILPPAAILGSNTSSIPLVKMASVTGRPEQVVGVHVFNPTPVLPLVEIVTSFADVGADGARGHRLCREAARQDDDPVAGSRGLHRQRPADSLPAFGDPDARVRLRHRRGHRRRHGAGAAPTRRARSR